MSWASSNIPFPDNPRTGTERDDVVLTLEAGYLLGRERRFGQVWLGVRALVPVRTSYAYGPGPTPDFPFAILTARFLL